MDKVWVGTRKGLFVVKKAGGAWSLGKPAFPGEPVTQVLVNPHDGAWYVALRLGHFGVKMHKSTDQGASWKEIAAPAFPPKPTEGPMKDDATPWTVDLIWGLAAGPGELWAGCLPAGLFKSADGGASWQLVESLWNRPERREWLGGGYDHAGIHSIHVDPRDAKHVTVAISCGGVWRTRDGGASWDAATQGMTADYMPPERRDDPNIQDPHYVAMCAAHPEVLWCQHHGGMYRTGNGGGQWDRIDAPSPSAFGFVVAAHPTDPLRAWFAPAVADQNRVAVDGKVVVNETRDGGKTFVTHSKGLPDRDAYHLIYRHALDVARDGKGLAMASTTGGLWVSEDEGASWACLSRDLPPVAVVRVA